MMILFSELTNPDVVKLSPEKGIEIASKTCSFGMISIYHTRSMAVLRNNQAVDNFLSSHSDCKRIGGQDAGCLWGDFACVVEQEMECSGNSCK
jgi:hypothetical protein